MLVSLIVFPRDPSVDPRSLFACRVMRGQEVTSTNQVMQWKGSSWESPTASSLMSFMPMEELRSFCQVLDGIILELSDGPAHSIVG